MFDTIKARFRRPRAQARPLLFMAHLDPQVRPAIVAVVDITTDLGADTFTLEAPDPGVLEVLLDDLAIETRATDMHLVAIYGATAAQVGF